VGTGVHITDESAMDRYHLALGQIPCECGLSTEAVRELARFNLRVGSSFQFGQSENQNAGDELSEERNRQNGSTLSWLAHVFTRSAPIGVARCRTKDLCIVAAPLMRLAFFDANF
jgi:hypothetical protein